MDTGNATLTVAAPMWRFGGPTPYQPVAKVTRAALRAFVADRHIVSASDGFSVAMCSETIDGA